MDTNPLINPPPSLGVVIRYWRSGFFPGGMCLGDMIRLCVRGVNVWVVCVQMYNVYFFLLRITYLEVFAQIYLEVLGQIFG